MTHKSSPISAVTVLFFTGLLPPALHSQTFDSRSTGVDGALELAGTPAGTTVELDPAARGIDLDGDNVFHFTTVHIPADVTLKLRPGKLKPAPVYWLAQGTVDIDGVVDLNGENGHDAPPPAQRVPSTPGPGGYPGGLGVRPGIANTNGYGPGGRGGNASHDYGNDFLRPLVGGSGGAGGVEHANLRGYGAGGGAGGGALLIASSVSISISGRISANAGNGGRGGADGMTIYAWSGSGGEIHILAPMLSGVGRVEVAGGFYFPGGFGNYPPDNGRIRIETYTNTFRGTLTGSSRVVTLSPNIRFLPAPNSIAFVRAVRIHGVDVPLSPTGSFVMPDVTIDTTGAVTVEIQAVNIPLGTAVGLEVHNETRGILSFSSTPLTGTLGSSTATVSINPFPSGFSQVLVRARW